MKYLNHIYRLIIEIFEINEIFESYI
jgi:hypothetical protein